MKVKVRKVSAPAEHDPTVPAKLTPSWHGMECLGNGDFPGYECCCEECDHYLECFPDWRDEGR